MPKGHRNPFIPHERALELDSKNLISEKESKVNYSRQEAMRKQVAAPVKQRKEKENTGKE